MNDDVENDFDQDVDVINVVVSDDVKVDTHAIIHVHNDAKEMNELMNDNERNKMRMVMVMIDVEVGCESYSWSEC